MLTMMKRYRYKYFKGDLHRTREYVRILYPSTTFDSLVKDWMKDIDVNPQNWIQRALKSFAEEKMTQDFRLW